MVARWFPPGMPPSACAGHDAVLAQLLATDPGAYANAAQALQAYDLAPGLQALQARTLLVHGELDEDVPAHFTALGRRYPGLRVLGLPAIGHFPNLQAPAAFNAALADFLDGLA
jgi:3-oxoadipate enol-lactonase